MNRPSTVLRIVAVGVVCAVALFFWLNLGERGSSHELRVIALDVGQGDAILIITPNGQDVLIDGGPDQRAVERLSANLPAWDKTLELVILTHPDYDHVGGLPKVAEHYRIERVLETLVRSSSKAAQQWEEELSAQKSERIEARADVKFTLDNVDFSVLWPQSEEDLKTKKRNDTSVVVETTYGETSFLFTGDISSVVEERLVVSGTLSDIDVLKVPHHGSISSSNEEFLDVVKPEWAVISTGKGNRYGHPHPVVMRRLEKRGMKVLRTDEVGDIEIVSDGKNLRLISQ